MAGDAARLTVIVPAFNEALRISKRAVRLESAVEAGVICPRSTELIVVDDGSTDETALRAEEIFGLTFPRLRVLRMHDNAGKGAAVRLGAAAATAPVVLFMDADMAVDPSRIPYLVKAIGPADVAIGSRAHAESVVVTDGVKRQVMGLAFNRMVHTFTKMPFRDTQCGFKAFRTPLARILFHLMRVQGFAFDVELLSLACRLQMEIIEVAVHWSDIGQSTLRTLVDPFYMTRDVMRLRQRRAWPKIPALGLSPSPGERRRSQSRVVGEVLSAVGSNYPIVTVSDDESLVLLPLCDPIKVHNLASRLRRLPTRLTVRERSVSLPRLQELAPFRWIDGENDGFMMASHTDVSNLITRKPIEGWESVRSRSCRRLTTRRHVDTGY